MNTDKNLSSNSQNQQGSQSSPAPSPLDRYTAQPQQQEEQSPFYKSNAPTISLPKGGGALKGIDEKFSVNAVNGTAGMTIPFPLTPGRGGFTPALSLNYNSGSGNSEFGLGWGLSLPFIQRKTDKKLPLYNDAAESDVFLLAGAEDLVPVTDSNGNPVIETSGVYTIKKYRPRIEGLFARIEYIHKQDTVGGWWRVTTKDNITTWYGLDITARVVDPEYDYRVFKWLPQLVTDHRGNVQWYSYIKEDHLNIWKQVQEKNRLNGTAPFTNTYLKRVRYCNRTAYYIDPSETYEPALPDPSDFLMEAVLDYGDQSDPDDTEPGQDWLMRNDAFSDFHAGFEIRTYRKCYRVLMYHHFTGLNGHGLVRTLELNYYSQSIPAQTLIETDFVVSAVQKGYVYKNGNYRSKALPAVTFDYQPMEWNTTIQQVDKADFQGAPQGLTGPYQWIDFEGEGISGILTEQSNGWFYKNNLGDGNFDTPKTIAPKPSFNGLSGGMLQWQDLDADGRRQVVADSPSGYWELDDDQQWQPFQHFDHNANIDWNSPFTRMIDLNGDGKADILITEDRAWCWYENLGTEGYAQGGNAPLFSDEEKGPVLLLRDPVQCIFLADMNGDGLTDLVRIKNGEVCYWPNMGYGKFGARVTMSNAPVFAPSATYNPLYLTLADISGTGAADLIYIGDGQCTAWINLSGNGFAAGRDINPLPATDPYSKIAVLDFLGNGTACIVWSSPLPRHATAPLQYIDLMGGNKPYLMRSYNNGQGKQVSVTYKSSTQFYLADKLTGIPWATRLPFPVHCISSITTEDSISQTTYSQSYKYRHGYYDHEEREFRGFGYVETLDIDSAAVSDNAALDQAPVLTKTWYHTGAWMREATLLEAFQQEYFPIEGWDEIVAIAAFDPGDMDPQEMREAHRALKGSPLRQEVYAQDGTALEKVPYAVTASAYTVKRVQKLFRNRYASFLNLQQQSIAFSCERQNDDPRILQQLTLETDEYGNVKQSAQVAYPRYFGKIPPVTTLPQIVKDEQAKMHITCSETSYTNDAVSESHYRLRLPYETKGYEANVITAEVSAGALWTVASLKSKLDGASEVPFDQQASSDEKRLLSRNRVKFRENDAVTELDFGLIESLAIPHESYQLAFTEALMNALYEGRVDGAMLWDHGYVPSDNYELFWVPSGRATYIPNPEQSFYTPVVFTDPWNMETLVSYDPNWLLPVHIEDAVGNTSSIDRINWHSLQPEKLTDLNLNVSEILYDALGMPVAMALKGKDDNTEGDTLDGIDPENPTDQAKQTIFMDDPEQFADDLLQGATWRCVYDFNHLPVAAAMIARQHHVYGAVIPTGQGTAPLIRFSYSDGMGRVIMHKAQAQPTLENSGKEWLGSGRTIYNNKGNAVMQYEPYYSISHRCDTAEQAAEDGISPRVYYDPLGRALRTDLPDGSFTQTTWTSWEQTIWDNNDTVLESQWYIDHSNGTPEEQDAAAKAEKHAGTPTVMHTDTLARGFYTIQHNRYPDSNNVWQDQYIHSYVNLDIQGNRLSVTDGRGLEPLQYRYNMLQAVCRQISIDSGQQFVQTDVGGQPVYTWDTEDRTFQLEYDELRRLVRKGVTDNGTFYLLERMEYGESISGAYLHNLLGQLYRHYDGSGMQQVNHYDFKGNPTDTQQQLLADPGISDVDWYNPPALNTETFTASGIFDALNRPTRSTDPGGNETEYLYDRGGALKTVRLNADDYVQDIHYDAKGQRQAIWYGNQTKTGYTYDPLTYRLSRLLTVNLDTTSPDYNKRLQDLYYYYDPVGNITKVTDEAQEEVFFDNTVVSPSQDYTYDALYRLVKAMGRERKNNASFDTGDNNRDQEMQASEPLPWDANALQNYMQQYTYDAVGNIVRLRHTATLGSYTRNYNYGSSSNKLASTEVGSWLYTYGYEARGNMNAMPHLDNLYWNSTNELNKIERGTTVAYYQYSGGQRIRKYTNNGSTQEERIYLGSYEIYRKFTGSSLTPDLERVTVHISDDTGRIAMLEKRTIGSDPSPVELTRYIYSNHLQSATLELNEVAEVISYEEYHPYGTTAYQANNSTINAIAKRYRYTGKERDEESGLYYHGARYYIPWLARWTAVDPLESKYAGMSPYNYSFNNPVMFNDPSGMEPGDPEDGNKKDKSIADPNRPKMPPINTSGRVDNARDVRSAVLLNIPAKSQNGEPLRSIEVNIPVVDNARDVRSKPVKPIAPKAYSGNNMSFNAMSQDEQIRFDRTYKQHQWEKIQANNARLDPFMGGGGDLGFGFASSMSETVKAAPYVLAPEFIPEGLAIAATARGVFSLNKLTLQTAVAGSANLTAQVMTNSGSDNPNASFSEDLSVRFSQVNVTSVGAAIFIKNPFVAEGLASGFKLTAEKKFDDSYFLGKMSTKEYVLNIGVVGSLGTYANKGLFNANISSLSPYFNKWGIKFAESAANYSVNTMTNTMGNIIVPTIMNNTKIDTTIKK